MMPVRSMALARSTQTPVSSVATGKMFCLLLETSTKAGSRKLSSARGCNHMMSVLVIAWHRMLDVLIMWQSNVDVLP